MGIGYISGGDRLKATMEAMKEIDAKEEKVELNAERIAADKAMQADTIEMAFRPRVPPKKKAIKARSKTIAKLKGTMAEKMALPLEKIKDQAQRYQQKNQELNARSLVLLRGRIKPDAKMEDIEEILREFYSDPSLADEALQFLLDTTDGDLKKEVQAAKDKLNEDKGREIVAGRNISTQAREASEKGLGTPTSLRDMYRDITGNPRDSNTLFEELSKKYAFKELKKVADFLLHSLGADMKSKGPSIDRGELHRLLTETRSLQAILGVYRFFKNRMNLMQGLFSKGGIPFPKTLNFELMSKSFMSLAGERYPSPDKVLSQAKRLGIEDWILAKIIAFSQFRDSIRELAMSQIYRSLQHRDELFMAIIEALEDLEDELEEQHEREGEEEEEGKQEENKGKDAIEKVKK